jgi:hypothetical protein
MRLIVMLDFDGVLFNSAFEAYKVCELAATMQPGYRSSVSFDEFMVFRQYLTDAWQFNRLFDKSLLLDDLSKLNSEKCTDRDQKFADYFFKAREVLMQSKDWANMMSPYPFFFNIKKYLVNAPENFSNNIN